MQSFVFLFCLFVAVVVGQQVYYPEYYSSDIDNEPYGIFTTFNYGYYRDYVTNLYDDDEGVNPDDDDDGADDDDLIGNVDDDYYFDDDDLSRIDDDEQYDGADDDFEGDRQVRYESSSSILKPILAVMMFGVLL